MRMSTVLLVLAVLVPIVGTRAQNGQGPPTTVRPTQYDYQGVMPGESSLGQFTVAADIFGLPMQALIAGADAIHFALQDNLATNLSNVIGSDGLTLWRSCSDDGTGRAVMSCLVAIAFRPLSPGVKTARLVLTTKRGRVITVALRGEGLGAYSGSFGWQSDLNGESGNNSTDIKVTVVNGAATCSVDVLRHRNIRDHQQTR